MVFARRNAGKPSFSEKPTKTELDAKRKQYVAAKDLAARTVKPHVLDALIGKPVMAPDTQKSLDAALDKTDNVVLVTSFYGAMVKIGPMLGMKKNPKPTPLVEIGTVTGYKIDGDRATAQKGAETLNFTRIEATQDDAQTFTLKLPRQAMTEIKELVFLDAKGQPIEGRRTGSGYMNDAAEMAFSVKTAAPRR